jgi:hypothetical protein
LNLSRILKEFKRFCAGKEGWQIGEEGEWVKDHEGYHMIIWGRSLTPHTVRSMVSSGRMSIQDGEFWKVERAKLMIFVSEHLPDQVLSEIEESEELKRRVVVYDIGRGLRAGGGDEVSAQLEKFLGEKCGKTLKSQKNRPPVA